MDFKIYDIESDLIFFLIQNQMDFEIYDIEIDLIFF
jgi:hypothetical protein